MARRETVQRIKRELIQKEIVARNLPLDLLSADQVVRLAEDCLAEITRRIAASQCSPMPPTQEEGEVVDSDASTWKNDTTGKYSGGW
jgi:hypothetical protein